MTEQYFRIYNNVSRSGFYEKEKKRLVCLKVFLRKGIA